MLTQHKIEIPGNPTSQDLAAVTAPQRRWYSSLWNALSIVALLVLVQRISQPLLRHWGATLNASDFHQHSRLADQLYNSGMLPVPHFLYHLCLIGVYRLAELVGHPNLLYSFVTSGQNYQQFVGPEIRWRYAPASVLICLFATGLLAIVVWTAVRRTCGLMRWSRGVIGPLLAIGITVGLLLVAPVAVLYSRDSRMYLGYIGLNVWHSPTMVTLKPLAVLVFFYVASLFGGSTSAAKALSWRRILAQTLYVLGGAALTVASTLCKPNYSLCLLPALGVFVPWAWYRGMKIRWVALLVGVMIPAFAVLAWQYYFTYTQQIMTGRQNSVIFDPLLAISLVSPDFIGWKFLLSIVFPVAVLVLFNRHVLTDGRMVLAWLVFGCGAAWYYLFAEKIGPGDNNFAWGPQMALFILFLETILFLLRQAAAGWPASIGRRIWTATAFVVCLAAFGAHIAYGVKYNSRTLRMIVDGNLNAWW